MSTKEDTESLTTSAYSGFSKNQRSATYVVSSRYRWPSSWSFISCFMGGVSSLHFFGAFITNEKVENDSIIQYIAAYLIVGLPAHYMQTLLGQYTQSGVRVIRYICPIGHGVALTFISNMYLHCIMHGLLFADATIYFLSSMRTELQWMKCPDVVAEWGCWNGTSNCTRNCLGPNNKSSAFHYFIRIYLENAYLNPDNTRLIGVPSLSRSVLITSSWVLTGIILTQVYGFYQKVFVIIWNTAFVMMIFNMIAALIFVPKKAVVDYAMRFNASTILSPEIWGSTFTRAICYNGLGRAFHIIYGSYMSPTTASGTRSSFAVLYNFIVVIICSVFSRCKLLKLKELAHLDDANLKNLWEPGIVTYFIYLPFSYGLTNAPHFWCLQYFFLCMCILLNTQLAHIFACEKILSEHHPALIRYRRYVLGGIALSACLIGVGLSSKETYLVYKSITLHITDNLEVFNSLALSIQVCYIYGVQKFCDDVHFMKGVQPTSFWKISWYALPIFQSFAYFHLTFAYSAFNIIGAIERWVYFMLISPLPIAMIIESFKYIKKRNILGLFQSEESFGPPDPKERYLRRMFNPRKETRSQRKSDSCYHNCLLNSKILGRVAQEELNYKSDKNAS